MLWFLMPSLFRKSSGKNVNSAYIKKALVKFLAIFMPKKPDCRPRTGFCTGAMPQSMANPQSGTSKGGEGVKKITYPAVRQILHQRNCFCIGERSESWLNLIVPGEHQDKVAWGHLNRHQKRVHRCYLAVPGPLQKACLNWQGLGLIES